MQRPLFDDEFSDLARLAYRVAFRILGDRSAAEDIAQESLARAYIRWTRISEYRQAWVARVAGNLAIDQLRRKRPSTVAVRQVDAEVMVIERIDLQRALLGLTKRQREAVACGTWPTSAKPMSPGSWVARREPSSRTSTAAPPDYG